MATEFKEPVLTVMKTAGGSRGAIALRTWRRLMETKGVQAALPGAAERFVLTQTGLVIGTGPKLDKPNPMGVIPTLATKGPRVSAVFFSDRSVVVFREERGVPGRNDIVRILPVVLKLSRDVQLANGHLLRLSVDTQTDKKPDQPSLRLMAERPGYGRKYDVVNEETSDRCMSEDMLALCVALDLEISAWAAKLDGMPLIANPATGPRMGRLGHDAEAPRDGLDGLHYLWPSVFSHQSFAEADAKRIAQRLDLLFVRFWRDFESDADDAAVVTEAPMADQSGKTGPLKVTVKAAPKATLASASLERAMRGAWLKWLRHAHAPTEILGWKGSMEVFSSDRKTQTTLIPYRLHAARGGEVSSNHKKLQSVALFG